MYISNIFELQNLSSIFILKKKQITSAASLLSQQSKPMTYNIVASMDKPTCTDDEDFAKCQDRLGRFFWSKSDSNYLDVKLKVFKKDDRKLFRLVQNLTMGESDFSEIIRLKNQLVIAAENFDGEQNLFSIQIPTLSEDMDEQLKLADRVVDIVDYRNTQVCVIVVRWNIEKPESSFAQV